MKTEPTDHAPNPTSNPTTDAAAGMMPAAAISSPGDALAALVDQMQDDAPGVSERFAAKLQADEQAARPAVSSTEPASRPDTDSAGYLFDARYCSTDEAGQPKKTPAGRWIMKRDKKGTRYPKNLLKKAGAGKPAARKTKGRAGLILPDDIKEAAGPEPGAVPPPLQPTDLKRFQAAQLAAVIDGTYWSLSTLYADPAAVAAYKNQLSQPGQAAMADGFYQMAEVPEVPWWVLVAAIYAPATLGMLNHPASASKKEKIMSKLGGWWARMKARRAAGKRAKPGEQSRAGENAPDLNRL